MEILKRDKKYDFELWPLIREQCFLLMLYLKSSLLWCECWKCCWVMSFSHLCSRKSEHPTSTKWQIFKCSDNLVDDNGRPTKDFELNQVLVHSHSMYLYIILIAYSGDVKTNYGRKSVAKWGRQRDRETAKSYFKFGKWLIDMVKALKLKSVHSAPLFLFFLQRRVIPMLIINIYLMNDFELWSVFCHLNAKTYRTVYVH